MNFILPLFQCYSVDVYAEWGSWKYPIDESVSSFCVSCLTKLQTADIPKWKAKYQRTAWGCFFVVEREIIHSKWVLWPLDTSISNCRSAEDTFIIFISAGVYGFPACIHSDQRANFESFSVAGLLLLVGVEKSHTTLYHAMGNNQAERMNHTLGNTIQDLPPRSKAKWSQMSSVWLLYSTALFMRPLVFRYVLLDVDKVGVDTHIQYVESLGRAW